MSTSTVVVYSAAKEESMAEKNIPEEMINEILQRLSLRSIAKANCISKFWKAHISSKSLHLLLHSPISSPLNHHGFFFQSSNILKNGVPIHFFPNIPTTHFPNLFLLASSNGLLLCGRSNQNPVVQYSVWNPTSNRLISIPRPFNLFTGVKIGFHSHDSVSFTILRFGNLAFEQVEVFSSETGEWRRVAFNLAIDSFFISFEGPSAAVLNGVFYWLDFRRMIYTFDLLNNEFSKVEFPSEETEYQRNVYSRCLAVAGGEVVMASTDGEIVEIWTLRERELSLWNFKCRLSVETLVGNNANTLCATSTAAMAVAGGRFVGIVGFQPWNSERIYLNTTEFVICCDVGSENVEIVHRFDAGLGCTDVTGLNFFPYEPSQVVY